MDVAKKQVLVVGSFPGGSDCILRQVQTGSG